MTQQLTFPEGFLWGAATAAYQIEGAADEDGRGKSIWDTFCATPGKVENGDSGAVACDHYHRYKDDVALMKQIGLRAYRFSIAWPRILPEGTGTVNEAGLDFYDRLVDELLANDIQPWATLYHWDLPQTLEDRGGWPERSIIDAYVNYADVVSRRLGDRVKHWMTFNEPWVFTNLGYGVGVHAPGRSSMADYFQAGHHVLVAHGLAVPVLRANAGEDAQIGIAASLVWSQQASAERTDRSAALRWNGYMNRWFLDPLYKGAYPMDITHIYRDLFPKMENEDLATIKGPPDFLGINFYMRHVVTADPESADPLKVRVVPQEESEHTAMGWEVNPESMYNILRQTFREYQPGPMYITENGAAFDDELTADGEVNDTRRLNFYRDYLAQAHRAIQDGIPLQGYFAWSLLDNFEWAEGYAKRFGLTYVDYETQRRILKASGKWYSEVIRNNGFTID